MAAVSRPSRPNVRRRISGRPSGRAQRCVFPRARTVSTRRLLNDCGASALRRWSWRAVDGRRGAAARKPRPHGGGRPARRAYAEGRGLYSHLTGDGGTSGDCGTWRRTAEELAALSPDGARIYPVAVVRDTALYDMWRRGTYRPLTVPEGADAAADMLEVFLEHGIPVIRIGLNPTEELSGGAVVAGAYHPALGEMARSRVFLRNILRDLKETSLTGETSNDYGTKRAYFTGCGRFKGKYTSVRGDGRGVRARSRR